MPLRSKQNNNLLQASMDTTVAKLEQQESRRKLAKQEKDAFIRLLFEVACVRRSLQETAECEV